MSDAPSTYYCPRCLNTFEGEREACANLHCSRPRPREGWGRIHAPGEIFDRNYRLHRMLALGGAGVTYVGRELGNDGEEVGPELAIKVLLTARDQGPYLRRLANEAHIIQELDHPNIVHYLGFVHRAGHSPYLITRFEKGGSLLDYMRRVGTLSVRRAAAVARQICWALEKAHERGIIHRDLKPENVLLTRNFGPTEDPVIRVADFGIAKVQGSLGSNLTRVGAFVGTPLYAAPEQFVGGNIAKAADVYGVGALLHFLLVGRHVVKFADRLDPADTFQLLVENLPPKVALPHEATEDVYRVNRILSAAMAPEPTQRCTVVQLDEMLGSLLAGRDPRLPEQVREVTTGPLPPAGSVVGLAGAVEAVEGAVQPRDMTELPEITKEAARPPPPVVEPDQPVAELPGPERTWSLDPDTVEEAIGARPRRRPGRTLLFLAALALLAFLGLVVLVVELVVLRPDLVGIETEPPVDVAVDSADPAVARDVRAIRKSLDNLEGWLADQCSPPAGHAVDLVLVVEANGQVRDARAMRDDLAVDRCLARQVERATFNRTGTGPVRVRMGLSW